MSAAASTTGNEPMNPQLMTLMELQDLRAQHKALSGGETGLMEEETERFNIDLEEAREHLEETIEELEGRLSESVLRRYRILAPSRDRIVVPVIRGVCYGCFVSIPTATAGEQDIHQSLRSCQNCGCFIYVASST
jgi:predicted  nucleic acid-binding Zn-ribbon protein